MHFHQASPLFWCFTHGIFDLGPHWLVKHVDFVLHWELLFRWDDARKALTEEADEVAGVGSSCREVRSYVPAARWAWSWPASRLHGWDAADTPEKDLPRTRSSSKCRPKLKFNPWGLPSRCVNDSFSYIYIHFPKLARSSRFRRNEAVV